MTKCALAPARQHKRIPLVRARHKAQARFPTGGRARYPPGHASPLPLTPAPMSLPQAACLKVTSTSLQGDTSCAARSRYRAAGSRCAAKGHTFPPQVYTLEAFGRFLLQDRVPCVPSRRIGGGSNRAATPPPFDLAQIPGRKMCYAARHERRENHAGNKPGRSPQGAARPARQA